MKQSNGPPASWTTWPANCGYILSLRPRITVSKANAAAIIERVTADLLRDAREP